MSFGLLHDLENCFFYWYFSLNRSTFFLCVITWERYELVFGAKHLFTFLFQASAFSKGRTIFWSLQVERRAESHLSKPPFRLEWDEMLFKTFAQNHFFSERTLVWIHSLIRDDLAAHLEVNKCFKISPLSTHKGVPRGRHIFCLYRLVWQELTPEHPK